MRIDEFSLVQGVEIESELRTHRTNYKQIAGNGAAFGVVAFLACFSIASLIFMFTEKENIYTAFTKANPFHYVDIDNVVIEFFLGYFFYAALFTAAGAAGIFAYRGAKRPLESAKSKISSLFGRAGRCIRQYQCPQCCDNDAEEESQEELITYKGSLPL